jgi:hypothetical protein
MNNYSMINAMISDKLAEAEKALLVGDNPFLAISSLTLREVVDMEVTRLTTAIKNGALASIQTVISDLEEFYPKNLNINIKKN